MAKTFVEWADELGCGCETRHSRACLEATERYLFSMLAIHWQPDKGNIEPSFPVPTLNELIQSIVGPVVQISPGNVGFVNRGKKK